MDAAKIKLMADSMKDELIKIRRELHKIPELEFKEFKTAEYIKNQLSELGIEYRDNIAKTGIAGIIRGKNPGKTVLLRADMDALPVCEQTDVEYKSGHEGCMHACGHDAHVTCLLGAAKILSSLKDELSGNIVLMFQPAEEGDGGAKPMIDEGLLESPKVGGAFALHCEPDIECGKIGVKAGAVMASPDGFKITVKGKGGHGGYPHNSINPINTAAKIIADINELDKPEMSVITVCSVNSGNVYNVIPDNAYIEGTTRSFDETVREQLFDMIEKVCENVCGKDGADFEFVRVYYYPPLINDDKLTDEFIKSAKEIVGEDNICMLKAPFMGGEDFSYIANEVPSVYFYLGVRNEAKDAVYPLHSAKFNIDEDSLVIGAASLAASAMGFLNEKQ